MGLTACVHNVVCRHSRHHQVSGDLLLDVAWNSYQILSLPLPRLILAGICKMSTSTLSVASLSINNILLKYCIISDPKEAHQL